LATTPQPTNTAIGFATVNGNTIGGQAGPTVTVSNLTGFSSALAGSGARIVRVQGTINLGGSVTPGANKTIVGVGTNAALIGNLLIQNVTNVIVQNLRLSNAAGLGGADGLTVENSRHVWIDHCSFSDCKDGQLDVTHGSDYVTVSWCKFSYTTNSGHNFSSLVGHSDNNAGEDAGKLHVTYHHNWWSTLCIERMPRTRFGRIHVFNNYFHCPGNNYCVRASIESEVLIENNFFENVSRPYEKFAPEGRIRAVGNDTTTATGVQSFNDDVFVPPYAYTPQTPAAAKAAVISGAGGF
jgi:pectate lyase